jgi:hypothetical protein
VEQKSHVELDVATPSPGFWARCVCHFRHPGTESRGQDSNLQEG